MPSDWARSGDQSGYPCGGQQRGLKDSRGPAQPSFFHSIQYSHTARPDDAKLLDFQLR